MQYLPVLVFNLPEYENLAAHSLQSTSVLSRPKRMPALLGLGGNKSKWFAQIGQPISIIRLFLSGFDAALPLNSKYVQYLRSVQFGGGLVSNRDQYVILSPHSHLTFLLHPKFKPCFLGSGTIIAKTFPHLKQKISVLLSMSILLCKRAYFYIKK